MRSSGLLITVLLAACAGGDDPPDLPELWWDFEDGTFQGFAVDQTDFTPETRGDLSAEVGPLGAPLTSTGLIIQSFNYSDDQWVYAWRALGAAEGVSPSTTYRASIRVDLATAVPTGCIGVGGGPDAVYLKAGVAGREPGPVAEGDDYTGFSIDKGNQSQVGAEAVGLGSVAGTGTDCLGDNPWEIQIRTGEMTATSDAQGRLWFYVGTDSAHEGGTMNGYDGLGLTLTRE